MKENRRRQKEEEEMRKQRDRARKMAEFEKWKNPPKANFVISKRATAEDGVRIHRTHERATTPPGDLSTSKRLNR